MTSGPSQIPDPQVRALSRELASLAREVESLKRGQRASQLGYSSIDDGTLWVRDGQGVNRVAIGRQVDGKFGWGAVNGDPPPRPDTPQLNGTVAGVAIVWNGTFAGIPPSDFTHVKAHLSPVGPEFIPSDGNVVGHFLGAATMPVAPLDAPNYWCKLIAYNTSGAASEVSFTAGPAGPQPVVATEILDGIVTELKLADDAVTAAKLAAGSVGTAQLGDAVVDLSKLAADAVDATKIVDGSITPAKLSFSVEDIASIATYFQPDPPTGTIPTGSLWADSNDRNRLYRWSGAGWVELSDTGVTQALTAAQQAQTDAAEALSTASGAEAAVDGKVTVFYQSSAPSGANTGDLWIHTGDNNRLQRWSGTAWVVVADQRIATALTNAATAQSTADGKIQAFYQATAPASGQAVGDLWYKSDAGNLAHRWNGTSWVPLPAGSAAISDNAVTSTKIAGDAVVAGKIAANAVGTNQLIANSVVAGKIAADQITSTHIVAGGVQTANLAADAVAAGKIAADAVTARELAALSVLADKIAANQINAGHLQAGAVTADKLEATLALLSTLIAGDPNGWRTEIGDPTTPILFWNGEQTGFALSRDATTGQSNAYLSGRIEFGNGSQIEQDYLDLCQQPSTGFVTPKQRQARGWAAGSAAGRTSVTIKWLSATATRSLLLVPVLADAQSGSTPPTITMPSPWQQVTTTTVGTTRISLFAITNAAASRTTETVTTNLASDVAASMLEYSGCGVLDVVAPPTNGVGVTATTGTTPAMNQSGELQIAVWGGPAFGNGLFSAPTNGFGLTPQSTAKPYLVLATGARTTTSTSPVSSAATMPSTHTWLALLATFRAAPADPVPAPPPGQAVRLFTQPKAGAASPYAIDSTGRTYPVGRLPVCRVRLLANATTATEVDLYAQSNWGVVSDPYGMAAVAASPSTFSSITIPVSGWWRVEYRANHGASPADYVLVAFVTKNARAAANSIARGTRMANRAGGLDGTEVIATRLVSLDAGEVLYWGNWTSPGTSLFANQPGTTNFGVPTEITVSYYGPAT